MTGTHLLLALVPDALRDPQQLQTDLSHVAKDSRLPIATDS